MIVRLLFAQFRREVVRSADDRLGHRVRLRQLASNTQVADLHLVILRQEYIHTFDVAVEDLKGVQIVEAKTHLYEELPDGLLSELLARLSLNVLLQIARLAKLHDDVDGHFIHEGIIVFADVLRVNF